MTVKQPVPEFHAAMHNVAAMMLKDHGIKIERIDFEWIDTFPADKPSVPVLSAVKLTTSSAGQ